MHSGCYSLCKVIGVQEHPSRPLDSVVFHVALGGKVLVQTTVGTEALKER
jgi:hypothetical protein